MEFLAEDAFDSSISSREHAIFETGIKLAALFHLMAGAPIKNDPEVLSKIAEGLKQSISCQPFVKRVEVELIPPTKGYETENVYTKRHEFDYTYISGKALKAEVEIVYNGWHCVGKVGWNNDLNFPLMYIESIWEEK